MMTFGAGFSPAFLALFIQIFSISIVLLTVWASLRLEQSLPSLFLVSNALSLTMLQSFTAIALAAAFGVPIWWRIIHLAFPVTVLAAYQLGIPSEWYLGAFLLSLGIFWTVFKTQVPYFPSNRWVWSELVRLIPDNTPRHVIDVGSGIGRLPIYVSKNRPLCLVEGIEIAPFLWGVSCVLAFVMRSKAVFNLGDYNHQNFSRYDVVFAYLSPAAMPALWQKASSEMRAGSLLVSYEFQIPGMYPMLTIRESDDRPLLYVWEMPSTL